MGGSEPQPQAQSATEPPQATAAPTPAQAQGGAASEPQSTAASTATNEQDGTLTIGSDTTFTVNSAEGYSTLTTGAAEVDIQLTCGNARVVNDGPSTGTLIEIIGAEQGTFRVMRERDGLELTDLRLPGADLAQVEIVVHVTGAEQKLDVEVQVGDITLQGALPADTSARTGTGNIIADETVSVQKLDAETGAGDITLGRVELQTARAAIDAETVTGDIDLTIAGDEADLKIELEVSHGTATVNGQARANGEYNQRAASKVDISIVMGNAALTFAP